MQILQEDFCKCSDGNEYDFLVNIFHAGPLVTKGLCSVSK